MVHHWRIATLALPLAILLAAPPPGAALTLTAGSATVNVGDTFTIPLTVSGATDLMAFQFDLSYDSARLTALSVTDVGTDFEAAATAGGGALTGITGFLSPGLLSGVADAMSGAFSGLSGSGVLAEIEFTALAPGVSPLTLSNVFLDFAASGFDSVDGQVTVVSVPEPSALALLAVGLAALGLWRWARRRGAARPGGVTAPLPPGS